MAQWECRGGTWDGDSLGAREGMALGFLRELQAQAACIVNKSTGSQVSPICRPRVGESEVEGRRMSHVARVRQIGREAVRLWW